MIQELVPVSELVDTELVDTVSKPPTLDSSDDRTADESETTSEALGKSVRFYTNDRDEIEITTSTYPAAKDEVEDIDELFVSKEERRESLFNREKEVEGCLRYAGGVYPRCVEYLFHASNEESQETDELVDLLSRHDARGLEFSVSDVFAVRRDFMMKTVMNVQDLIREKGIPVDEGEHLLSKMCEVLSDSARTFATRIAQGDALEAAIPSTAATI